MAGYQDLFTDPMAAIGYGLLTSRQNPLGEGLKLLQSAEAAKRAREMEEEDRQYKRALLEYEAGQPKLQFNPVTGDMYDMRTGMPFSPGGAAPVAPDMGGGLPPPPTGLTPKERAEWNKQQIKATPDRLAKIEGAKRFDIALSEMEKNLDALKQSGNITSTENAPLENLGLSISNSWLGREVGDALGTERATYFENIDNLKPRLIAALAQATGQSSKSLDSNIELKLALDSLGSGSYESRKAAVDTIRKMFANPDLLKPAPQQQPSMLTDDSASSGASSGWSIRRID